MLRGLRYKLAEWITPSQEYSVVGLDEIKKLLGKIESSEEAKDLMLEYFKTYHEPVEKVTQIDAKYWHAYVIHTIHGGYLVTFKSNWLWNYGKMFRQPESKGTGLNLVIARYCINNQIDTLVIVRPKGEIYSCSIKERVDYSVENNTIREVKGMIEAHIPIDMLKPLKVM